MISTLFKNKTIIFIFSIFLVFLFITKLVSADIISFPATSNLVFFIYPRPVLVSDYTPINIDNSSSSFSITINGVDFKNADSILDIRLMESTSTTYKSNSINIIDSNSVSANFNTNVLSPGFYDLLIINKVFNEYKAIATKIPQALEVKTNPEPLLDSSNVSGSNSIYKVEYDLDEYSLINFNPLN